jgi:two-component system, oxyanion-binding sensor
LRPLIDADRVAGLPPLSFATVFPFSCHHYELRQWLLAGGIGSAEVNIGIITPLRMVESLASGWIDGYCVGEPWNQRAVQRGVGTIVATKADIRPDGLEKVLGLRADWAAEHGALVSALLRSSVHAAAWSLDPANRPELSQLLAEPAYVGLPSDLIEQTLAGAMPAPDSCRPRVADAERLLEEMRQAAQVDLDDQALLALAAKVWRTDLYPE